MGAGSVYTYCMCVMSSGISTMYIISPADHYSRCDCTLTVLSADPEMMLVSFKSTAITQPSCPVSVIFRVMSVGD